MSRIVIVAFAILLSLTGLFGYISYHLKGSLAKVEQALVLSENVRLEGEKALLNRDLSCKIDEISVVEVEKEKKELQSKVETLSEQITSLKSGVQKKAPIIITQKENSNVGTQQIEILIGSELLSSDLKRLLQSSYCTVEPNDPSCSSGQSSN